VRTAVYKGYKVIGIKRGYDGLLAADITDMDARSVAEIVHRGGTILLTARCAEMMTPEGQDKAAQICKVLGLAALIVIGGDGSFMGGLELSRRGVNIIGIPGTIDLDMAYTEYTIGFDTAVNTGMDAVNKIRDTSSSHERCSVIEVMGRGCGAIALWCGLVTGAEEIIIPEKGAMESDYIIEQIIKNRAKGKTHNLVIVAEGSGGTPALARKIEQVTGIESRATILGHLQRGGSPTALDRFRASMMGHMAVNLISAGEYNKAIAYRGGGLTAVDLDEALTVPRLYDDSIYQTMKILAI
jgi:6-phosphofructokinase 1